MILGRIAATIIKGYGERRAISKEEEKKSRFTEAYAAKVADEDERNVLAFFYAFPVIKTESYIEKFRKKLEREEFDDQIEGYEEQRKFFEEMSKKPVLRDPPHGPEIRKKLKLS